MHNGGFLLPNIQLYSNNWCDGIVRCILHATIQVSEYEYVVIINQETFVLRTIFLFVVDVGFFFGVFFSSLVSTLKMVKTVGDIVLVELLCEKMLFPFACFTKSSNYQQQSCYMHRLYYMSYVKLFVVVSQ